SDQRTGDLLMNKKLLAVAVAGALALPGVALAQSSVTISGFLKMGIDNVKLSNTPKNPSSESRVQDDSSRIIFNVREDLGSGLAAIAQIDWRVTPDTGTDAVSGNNHVGLQSKSWGRFFIGRQDLHYFGRESDLTAKGSLKADSISLLAFAGGGGTPIAGATRTTNVMHYTTPNWGGFYAVVAYSTNPTAAEADIGSGARKGRAWNIAPTLAGSNYQIGYSYWSQKADGAGAGSDQRGDRLFGSYKWGGFKVGLAWDKSKIKTGATGVTTSNRTAWSIPASYSWGAHEIHGHYTKARDDKATVAQDGAKMLAIAYAYNLSKRTSMALTYAKITNDAGAFYQPFTSTGALGNAASAAAPGEDPRILAATLRHAF
ncbi:MAG: porin, partial [Betaproteobacteria bacterium]